MSLAPNLLNSVISRGVAEIIVGEEFVRLLQDGKPLRLKMGFDPSSPDIHLGHVVGLRKLRQLQALGHQVILIVGDWTARIGDPSGQSVTRPMLTQEQVNANAETYLRQFFKVVDKAQTQVVWQSEWFGKFTLSDVIRLTSRFTVAQFLAREDFARRYQAGRPIAITELLYPLLQAYDSIAVKADVEFGGVDQKFNLLVGRELQSMMGQTPQQCFLVPLLVGTDGAHKMSKSLGNYIGVDESPNDMYGKVMSLPDSLILDYFYLVTDVAERELVEMKGAAASGKLNPMLHKKRLASEIVAQFHNLQAARDAEGWFEQTFQRREVPDEVPSITFRQENGKHITFDTPSGPVTMPITQTGEVGTADVIHGLRLAESKSEAKRLLAQGSVEMDGQRITSDTVLAKDVKDGTVIRVGKRRFVKLVGASQAKE